MPATLLSPEAVSSELHQETVEGRRRLNRHLPADLRF